MKLPPKAPAILIVPPFVQLNSPYPSVYYLASFLRHRGSPALVQDHSIGLFERIFCRTGLEIIFAAAEQRRGLSALSGETALVAGRFFSEQEKWCSVIDRLTAFLRGRDGEFGHLIALANGVLPGGPRLDAFLEQTPNPLPEAAPLMASKLFADLADFITVTVDKGFSLVSYTSRHKAWPAAGGFIFEELYRPYLEEQWTAAEEFLGQCRAEHSRFLLGVTIPFSGCFSGALFCAAQAKRRFGSRILTAAGGGYINTEYRCFMDSHNSKSSSNSTTGFLFDSFDTLSFDSGFDGLSLLFENEKPEVPLVPQREIFPDYSEVDFSRYITPVDDENPMHRLWSGGRWLKAYLAHGCYWRRCTFCDTSLDYITRFEPVDPAALFCHLCAQAEKTGVRGVHLVDEAAPLSSLLAFAECNRKAGLPLVFWGNTRFGNIGPDDAAVLAAGGLLGISAGIEVATESGLKRIGKGFDMAHLVSSCAALKEAGILVHAYLIYGYWDETEEEIIDSAEIVRQFFEQGLLDSVFWHKFILSRHSRLYAEWQQGMHPKLRPVFPGGAAEYSGGDLSFEGEETFSRYSKGLERLRAFWLSGRWDIPLAGAFSFSVPRPGIPKDYIANLAGMYAQNRDKARREIQGKEQQVIFLGSRPSILQNGKNSILVWYWKNEEFRIKLQNEKTASLIQALLDAASRESVTPETFRLRLQTVIGPGGAAEKIWIKLRACGAAVIS